MKDGSANIFLSKRLFHFLKCSDPKWPLVAEVCGLSFQSGDCVTLISFQLLVVLREDQPEHGSGDHRTAGLLLRRGVSPAVCSLRRSRRTVQGESICPVPERRRARPQPELQPGFPPSNSHEIQTDARLQRWPG